MPWAHKLAYIIAKPFLILTEISDYLVIPLPFHNSSMALESVAQCGADAFQEVRVQSLVVEFLLNNVQVLFSDTFTSVGKDSAGTAPNCFSVRVLRILLRISPQLPTNPRFLSGGQKR